MYRAKQHHQGEALFLTLNYSLFLLIKQKFLTGKNRSSTLLAWLCERTFFHLKINEKLRVLC